MFSRGTIVLALFVIVIAAIIGMSQFLGNQPPLEISVAVSPMAEDWMKAVVADFNESDTMVNGTTRVQVTLTTVSDNAVWQDNVGWSNTSHPDAWMPATSASVGYLASNIPYRIITNSTARTPLVWGGFESRVSILAPDGTLDWDDVSQAMQTNDGNWSELGGEQSWGFLKLAYPRPNNDIAGLAVLFSGAGEFTQSTTLNRSALVANDFNDWMGSIVGAVPNFQTLGNDPAGAMASRGTSVAEIALLPEALWLDNLDGLTGSDSIVLSYPATNYIFDFPIAMWDDSSTPEETKLAVEAFADYVSGAGQNVVTNFGLRPANGEPDETASVFANAVSIGVLLEPDYGQIVTAPDKNTSETLLERFG